ncbi:hypothetical protein SAMN02910418_02440, partial [Bowdeniella nasicola]
MLLQTRPKDTRVHYTVLKQPTHTHQTAHNEPPSRQGHKKTTTQAIPPQPNSMPFRIKPFRDDSI